MHSTEPTVKIPMSLVTDPKYAGLKSESIIAFALFNLRIDDAIERDWIDENGFIYFYYNIEEQKEILNVSGQKLQKIKKNLMEHDLLIQVSMGFGKSKRMYFNKFIL